MKNKTIYIGPSGSGKSYKALGKVVKNKGTTIILNYATNKKSYEEAFPELKKFEEKDISYNFIVEPDGKYFIANQVSSKQTEDAAEFVKFLIMGCGYGKLKDDKKAMVLFDDGSWNKMPNKLLVLWQLSHAKCGISITVKSINDLLDLNNSDINEQMLKDIKRYWNIVYCSRSDWEKSQ